MPRMPPRDDAEAIANRLHDVKARIESACARCARDPGQVRLLLATKTVPPERVAHAIRAGARLLGANKVQEGRATQEAAAAISGVRPEWHFIGHLQTNKVADVLKWTTLIQSVDRASLADKLQRRLEYEDRSIDVFMQVNTSAEPSKFGVAPGEAVGLARHIASMDRLRLRGLMTIGLLGASPEDARPSLRLLRIVFDRIREERIPGVDLRELSMGMSGDLEVAIEEGATIVRLGTAVFGQRPTPDSFYWPGATDS